MSAVGAAGSVDGNRARRLAALLLLLAPLAGCGTRDERPNLLVISIDTLRADHLGCYGYARNTSPAIDAVARGGTTFQNAWSTTTWTLPSHVSMMTGLPISAHAQCDWDLEATLAVPAHRPRGRHVAEALAASGYETAGFYSCLYLEPKYGFGAGFETWERAYHSFQTEPGVAERWKRAREANDVEAMRAIHRERPELFDLETPHAPEAVDKALAWLGGRKRTDDPFLLFLHVYDVHSPYTPPAPFDTRFDPEYTGTLDGKKVGDADSPFRAGMDSRDLEHVIALYDGEIAAVDRELSRLFAELDRRGLGENTLVVITADHGEEFFEHGAKLHGGQLYRETLQVPLIVRWPGRVPAGERRSETVGLIDLAPTLRAAAGLEPDPLLPGVDLARVAHGREDAEGRTLTASLIIRRGVAEPLWKSAWIDSREHVILFQPGTEHWSAERFDLLQNPRELAPPARIAPEDAGAAAVLERLAKVRAQLLDLRERAPPMHLAAIPLDAGERVALEALGYSSSSPPTVAGSTHLCVEGCIWRP